MLFRTLLSLALFTSSTSLLAEINNRGILELLPIKGLAFSGKALTLGVVLPCDAKPVGVYFDMQKQDDDLRVAYLVSRQSVVCAGMPRLHTEALAGLAYKNIKRIVKMSPASFPRRLSLVYADEVLKGHVGKTQGYTALVPVRCGNLYGAVWSNATGAAEPSMAMVGEEVKKDAADTCVFSYRNVGLPFLSPTLAKVKVMRPQLEPSQSYDLQVRKISSYKRLAANRTVFRFKRACNEAPVALLTSYGDEALIDPKGKAARLGILTARFINKRCGKKNAQVNDDFVLDGYTLQPSGGLTSFLASKGFAKFHLKAPKAALLDRNAFEVSYLKTCHTPVALALYPGEHKAAVAVLERSVETECNIQPKEVSFRGSLATTNLGETKVFPLQLGGSAFY